MTPQPRGGLYCYRGTRAGAKVHGRFNVSNRALLPWIQAQAARFAPSGTVKRGPDDGARAALEARREGLGWAVADRLLSREKAAAAAAEIDAELIGLEAASEAVNVPERIDWERWAPGDINAYLRTLWQYVELDAEMRPVRAEWRIPAEWLR